MRPLFLCGIGRVCALLQKSLSDFEAALNPEDLRGRSSLCEQRVHNDSDKPPRHANNEIYPPRKVHRRTQCSRVPRPVDVYVGGSCYASIGVRSSSSSHRHACRLQLIVRSISGGSVRERGFLLPPLVACRRRLHRRSRRATRLRVLLVTAKAIRRPSASASVPRSH